MNFIVMYHSREIYLAEYQKNKGLTPPPPPPNTHTHTHKHLSVPTGILASWLM